jgi:hypothetical protein
MNNSFYLLIPILCAIISIVLFVLDRFLLKKKRIIREKKTRDLMDSEISMTFKYDAVIELDLNPEYKKSAIQTEMKTAASRH